MLRHLRHKFAIEVFRGINRLIDVDWFPSDDYIDAWRALYLLEGIGLDSWYTAYFKKHNELWHQIGDKPFHIPKEKHLVRVIDSTSGDNQK